MKQTLYMLCISCFLFFACNSKAQKHDCNEKVKQLNDSAVAMALVGDTAKIMSAIELLNEATGIEPNYYVAFWNKLVFQHQLGLMTDAFATLKVMEQFWSENPDLKMMLGVLYERHNEDPIQAMVKYGEANLLYKSLLDTINPNSLVYQSIITNYALNLKMLGREVEANDILYSYIKKYNEEYKLFVDTFMIKTTREDLLNAMIFSNGSPTNLPR